MQAGRRLHTSRAVCWVNTGAQAAAVRRWLLVWRWPQPGVALRPSTPRRRTCPRSNTSERGGTRPLHSTI